MCASNFSLHLQFCDTNNHGTSFHWDIGRRDGGDGGDEGGKAPTKNPSNRDRAEPRGNPPLNLAQLRALRAEAAEARVPKGSSSASSSTTSLAPLTSVLMLARKVRMRFTTRLSGFKVLIPFHAACIDSYCLLKDSEGIEFAENRNFDS